MTVERKKLQQCLREGFKTNTKEGDERGIYGCMASIFYLKQFEVNSKHIKSLGLCSIIENQKGYGRQKQQYQKLI